MSYVNNQYGVHLKCNKNMEATEMKHLSQRLCMHFKVCDLCNASKAEYMEWMQGFNGIINANYKSATKRIKRSKFRKGDVSSTTLFEYNNKDIVAKTFAK